jgi:hypothetical protein
MGADAPSSHGPDAPLIPAKSGDWESDMADDNRWSDRDRDWRDDRGYTEPGMGHDGRWHGRGAGPRSYGDGGRDSPGYNPAGPAQDGGRGRYEADRERQGAATEADYRAARAYQEGDLGYPDQGGRGYRGAQGSGGYAEARPGGPAYGPRRDYREVRSAGGYERGPDYGYGPYTTYGPVTEGETSSDYHPPAAWRGDDIYRGPSRGPVRAEEHRSWMERTGEKLGHFVRDLTPPDFRAGQHHGRGPKGYKRSDERIREDVSDRLTEDGYLDATRVEVGVENGEVTLNGWVAERAAKRRAEDLAEAVSGVTHVQNNLRVDRGAVSEGDAIID